MRKAISRLDRLSAVALLVSVAEIALIGFSLLGIVLYQQATSDRFRSSTNVQLIDETFTSLLNAETGQRGYIITGDSSYLPPYRDGLEALQSDLGRLSERVDGDGPQREAFERVQSLVEAKVAELEQSVALRAAGDEDGALAIVSGGEGLETMNDLRREFATIRTIEADRLDSRIDRADRYGVMTGITAVALAVVTLGILAWLYFAIRRQHEAQTLREVARAKDEFVGFVSHELRTPIALISGNARLLAGDGKQPDVQEQQLAAREILDAGERLQSIVATLLKLAKAESGGNIEVEPVLVHRIAANVGRIHATRYPGRRIELTVAEEVQPALGDRDAIEQVLVNLLSNAEKYGDAQAPIRLDVRMEGTTVSVGVANEGPPLDPREFERVFEPFFRAPATATRDGVGLGLTVCHRLVVAQGGRLSASARPGGGAIFSFTLPAALLEFEE